MQQEGTKSAAQAVLIWFSKPCRLLQMHCVVGAGGLDARLPQNRRAKAAACVLGERLWVVGAFYAVLEHIFKKIPEMQVPEFYELL